MQQLDNNQFGQPMEIPESNNWEHQYAAQLIEPVIAPSARKKSRKPMIALVFALVMATSTLVTFFAITISATNCLTLSDYEDLTQRAYAGQLDPTDTFYDTAFTFVHESPEYEASTRHEVDTTLGNLSNFYKKNSSKPMEIVLGTAYVKVSNGTSTNAHALSIQRIDMVRAALVKLGVPDHAIETKTKAYTPTGSGDDTPEDIDIVTLRLTSSSQCK